MARPLGTPDFQRGIAQPQIQLAYVQAGGSQSVNIPPNCQTLWVVAPTAPATDTIEVKGDQSGQYYNVASAPLETPASGAPIYMVPVNYALDSSVTISWPVGGGTDWYVLGDLSNRVVFDAAVASAIYSNNDNTQVGGMLIAGNNASTVIFLECNHLGQLRTTVGATEGIDNYLSTFDVVPPITINPQLTQEAVIWDIDLVAPSGLVAGQVLGVRTNPGVLMGIITPNSPALHVSTTRGFRLPYQSTVEVVSLNGTTETNKVSVSCTYDLVS